jgi:RNA polymerase sigma-70 factor (ECF subfamily)
MQNFRPNEAPRPIESLSDESLIQAIARGTSRALELLYDRYNRLLYSFAYRIVNDHQVAEDILQDAFVSVWKNASTYAVGQGPVRSWLVSIVHHRAIDYIRSAKRRGAQTNTTLDVIVLDENLAQPDVWDEVWQSVQRKEIRAALMQIPAEQRMVIELAYFQGWTQSEIAQGCQIPLGTVKARIRLGLMRMKKILEESKTV